MLELYIPGKELFNDETQEFITTPGTTLKLEHSLLSVRKWESKWKKSFLNTKQLNKQEMISYVQCMTIGQPPSLDVYNRIDRNILKTIQEYIDDTMTATTFSNQQRKSAKNEIITAELIYYWMVDYGIPFECEKWHLSQLLTLIQVCAVKGGSSKKMSKKDIMRQNSALNAARRKASGSKG